MTRKFRVAAGALVILLSGCSHEVPARSSPTPSDALQEGFLNPPQSARPRVWWHWMNGNITTDGIDKDISWMAEIGIGGLQNFDASLVTPQIVDERLVYMSPEWKEAFRFAAARAKEEGLELAIAGSPGWSETGGPWVPLQDGIKKLTWSVLDIEGGDRFTGALPQPPATTGPFLSIAAEGALGLAREGGPVPEYYRDVAVLALPQGATRAEVPMARIKDGLGRAIDPGILSDGDYEHAVDIGETTPGAPASLQIDFSAEQPARSATLFMLDAHPAFNNPRFSPVLEARIGGEWKRIAEIELSSVPTTVAFEPVRAESYRVLFEPYSGPARPQQTAPAPGVITPPFIAPVTGPAPARIAEFYLSDEAAIDRFEVKAGFGLVNDYHSLSTSASPEDQGIDPARVIDLTDRLSAEGTLDWQVPEGEWRIVRLGWSLTGKTNHPASPEATGLEVDKLDGDAVERYLRHYLDMYRETVGEGLMGKEGLQALLLDSTEVGPFNWTPGMLDHFERMRGYDARPWLPALAGILVGTRAETDRFLYDFRRTVSELHVTQHYATVARVAHDYGLTVYGEALEDQRPVFGDDMAMRQFADIPMAAIWTWGDAYGPRPTLLGDMKGASSIAHIQGNPIVAAESLTSALSPWSDSPASLRRVIDLAFAYGITRPVIHTSVHQPLDDKKPGLSLMVFGQFFSRHETWAGMAKAWIDYMSRSAYLLQQGRNVADVAYLYGEEAPLSAVFAFGPPKDLPQRYAYDFVNAAVLSDVLSAENGKLVAPSGASYEILYLGAGTEFMTLATLERIAGLVSEGVTVAGLPPVASPSLGDDARKFEALANSLWPGGQGGRFGRGRTVVSQDVEQVLAGMGIRPDVDIFDSQAASRMMFVHRKLEDGDLYFILNRSKDRLQTDVSFRVTGKAPDIWRADSGSVRPASYRQGAASTTLPLSLMPEESFFIVFRKDTGQPARVVPEPAMRDVMALPGPWLIHFEEGRGAPESAQLPALHSLSEHSDPGIRYFSGEATYTVSFALPDDVQPGAALWLDLGSVGDIAGVTLNGEAVGTVWHAPYRIDISAHAKAGDNHLQITVANTWVNRLIGDAQTDAEAVSFVTIPTYEPDAPLRPSGLIGPVRLETHAEIP